MRLLWMMLLVMGCSDSTLYDQDPDGDGFIAANGDCEPENSEINPEAQEICDGFDNDCDGLVDDEDDSVDLAGERTFYADADGDGFGDPDVAAVACEQPPGFVENTNDCDDSDPTISPNAAEICDGLDNDCDGALDGDDDGVLSLTWYDDDDGDGYGDPDQLIEGCDQPKGATGIAGDCNDTDATVHENAPERCDGLDNDCDDQIDEDVQDVWYADTDSDAFGDPGNTLDDCDPPLGYVGDSTDCNDEDPHTHPGAASLDSATACMTDADGDQYGDRAPKGGASAGTDCDDEAYTVNPSAVEVCDGIDNNCDGDVDTDAINREVFYADADNDSYGDSASTTEACSEPSGYVSDDTDCNDTTASANPAATEVCDDIDNDCDGTTDEDDASDALTWYADSDGDGYGGTASISACEQPTDFADNDDDCNDSEASANPGASEVCDEIDNDCDGTTDEDVTTTYYADADGDGYGNAGFTAAACSAPAGYTSDDTDCDDSSDAVNPGASEVCNEIDDDCDTFIDEGVQTTYYADSDSDGYGDAASSTDACWAGAVFTFLFKTAPDTTASANPGASEVCDEIDNDCDGTTDEDDASDALSWYADDDGDAFGDVSDSTQACEQPSGYVSDDADCDDTDASINPAATEVCDSADNDCDGTVDEDDASDALTWYADDDSDSYGDASDTTEACAEPSGYVSDDTDCDDTDASINPAATEVCDSQDNDCDGTIDEDDADDALTWYADDDGDGYGDADDTDVACEQPSGYISDDTDCDDADADISPAETEVCDDIDNDCDGDVDEDGMFLYYLDADGDLYGDDAVSVEDCAAPSGYVEDAGDCDDDDASVNPSEPDLCDDIDNDCDDEIDEDESFCCPDGMEPFSYDGDDMCIDSTLRSANYHTDEECTTDGYEVCTWQEIQAAVDDGLSYGSAQRIATLQDEGCCCPCGSSGAGFDMWDVSNEAGHYCECWAPTHVSDYLCCTAP